MNPGSWTSYGYNEASPPTTMRGYQWVRPDYKTAQLKAVSVFTSNQQMTSWGGLSLSVDIQRPEVTKLTQHGFPEGTSVYEDGVQNPEKLVWYSYTSTPSESGNQITWTQHEAFIVPVDFYVTFTILPLSDGSWGAFEGVDFGLN